MQQEEKELPSKVFGMDQEKAKQMVQRRRQMLEQGLLIPIQLRALQWVDVHARILAQTYTDEVLPERFRKMGIKDKHSLSRTLEYIEKEAPILIHVHLGHMIDKFLKDTHYRNLFETGHGSGCKDKKTRSGWEDRMFAGKTFPIDQKGIYHDAKPCERVKYGVLNIVNDPRGIDCCSGYGSCFFVMRNETVRLRTTFAQTDSSSSSTRLASCEHYSHVLSEYSNAELQAIVDVANGTFNYKPSDVISNYKEIQIHGDVRFDRDIDAVVLSPGLKKNEIFFNKLAEFVSKNNIRQVIWMDDLPKFDGSKTQPGLTQILLQ